MSRLGQHRLDIYAEKVLAGDPSVAPPAGGGTIKQAFFIQDGAQTLVSNQLIPNDNTIPQIGEGQDVITLACTGLTIGNILEIDWNINYASGGANVSIMAPCFIDAIANAIGVAQDVPGGTAGGLKAASAKARFTITAATHTVRIRIGSVSNVTISVNGQSGAVRFGGVSSTYISAKEIAT